jgi:integrase
MGTRRVAPWTPESVPDRTRSTPDDSMQLALFVPTLRTYCARWAPAYNCAPWVSDRTAYLRRIHLQTYILPLFGDCPLDQISVVAVGEWQQQLLASGRSVGFIKHIATSFGAPLQQAYREGLIERNPLRALRWPRRNSGRPDPYTPRETRRMIRWFAANQPVYLPLVGLVCLAGMRPSEACGLRWEDLDLDRGIVCIERSAVNRVVGQTKTRRSRRRIKLPGEVVAILAAVERRYEWVCTDPAGQPVQSAYWGGYYWHRACRLAGVRYRGFYRGRAAFLSAQAAKGANLLALSEYTGTSMRMLEDHYLRWTRALDVPGEKRRRRHG